ncbi:hypothetical protein CDD81_3162 [Ophiocordyceps australis]|uniref:C2H2-type domain-containing protein n=1 Tax=Ophiocordyceps australis TaxID=1399860 RepID=A0A2C5XWY2_9HYPO|nr:hypothetical protein CDD81_3162 [Ophiocordyceps australis]
MSAVAIQFDPTFAMGSTMGSTMGPRSAFTWSGPLEPGLSSAGSMLDNGFGLSPHGPEHSLTPPTESKSLWGSSPARSILTLEQLEMRRERERARRDSKLSARIRRTNSHPYSFSPPMTMGSVSNTLNMPAYTTAPSSVPLMTTPTAALSSPSYMTSYGSALQDQQHQGGQVFASPYQQSPLQPGYGVSIDYPTASYGTHGEYSTRTASLPVSQDSPGIGNYQLSATASRPSTNASSHDGGNTTNNNNSNNSNNNHSSSTSTSTNAGSHVRVVQSRPKPRCWEHGCNGRQFSTFSNLLRHQREKSGQAAKATCPNCGAEFTRTTARNGHLLHDKCKQRRHTRDAVP